MPDRSREMPKTKRDTLVLQIGGWAWGLRHYPGKKKLRYENLEDASEGFHKQTTSWIWRRRAENRDEWRHALREAKARKGL
jgi:hypothetical protein